MSWSFFQALWQAVAEKAEDHHEWCGATGHHSLESTGWRLERLEEWQLVIAKVIGQDEFWNGRRGWDMLKHARLGTCILTYVDPVNQDFLTISDMGIEPRTAWLTHQRFQGLQSGNFWLYNSKILVINNSQFTYILQILDILSNFVICLFLIAEAVRSTLSFANRSWSASNPCGRGHGQLRSEGRAMVGCMEATRQQVPWGFCKFSLGDIFRQLPTIAMLASAKQIQNVVMMISFIPNAHFLILSHLLTVHSLGLTTSAMLPLPSVAPAAVHHGDAQLGQPLLSLGCFASWTYGLFQSSAPRVGWVRTETKHEFFGKEYWTCHVEAWR